LVGTPVSVVADSKRSIATVAGMLATIAKLHSEESLLVRSLFPARSETGRLHEEPARD
jgi:hypothetical protein